jgi:hypothetical protein
VSGWVRGRRGICRRVPAQQGSAALRCPEWPVMTEPRRLRCPAASVAGPPRRH